EPVAASSCRAVERGQVIGVEVGGAVAEPSSPCVLQHPGALPEGDEQLLGDRKVDDVLAVDPGLQVGALLQLDQVDRWADRQQVGEVHATTAAAEVGVS